MSDLSRYFGAPVDPKERNCEFCPATATQAFELVAHKHYVYTCDEHIELGGASVRRGKSRRDRRSLNQDERLFDPGPAQEAA